MDFHGLIDRIGEKSPLQAKKLAAYLSGCDEAYFREADDFVQRYSSFLDKRAISMSTAVDAYLKMCGDMLRCQVAFLRSGRYPTASAGEATEAVYHDPDEMLSYMVGLAVSQFLWGTHYRMFTFFRELIERRGSAVKNYLEVGPGHGLFLNAALEQMPALEQAIAVDISPTSLELSEAIVRHFRPADQRVRFRLGDVTKTSFDRKFDFITMGEVLEHLDTPKELLMSLRKMLAPNGGMFVSTCALCPAIDHVAQFDTVDDIRVLIRASGFTIESELALPVETMSVAEAEKAKVTINYCAHLV